MAILEPDHRQSDRHSLAIWRIPVTLRLAAPDDTPELYRLGELDSRPLPPGPHLIAEREGRIDAALSLSTGESIADPFRRTAELRELLLAHAGRSATRPQPSPSPQLRPRPLPVPT
jgi:hypothetical protein